MAKKSVNGVGAFAGTHIVVPAHPPSSKPLYTDARSSKSAGNKSKVSGTSKKHKSQAK